jgi:hypothetical protein
MILGLEAMGCISGVEKERQYAHTSHTSAAALALLRALS